MRPYLPLAATLAAALAPLSPAAAEDTCLIRVSAPYGAFDVVHVDGTITCTAPFPGLSVSVCLESLKPASGSAGWVVEDCATGFAAPGGTTASATAYECIGGGPAIVRGTAFAVDQAGRPVSGFGPPTVVAGAQNCI